ncbi:hypothetical protein [Aminobacter aminovorans]|uniref:hypothetical protein n=1 Tax=Aminobacter aminovorans TaxID=83263 RepID=UPI00104EA3E1|nr:hypothetical protein [Aminobacter aminovorans]
MAIFIDSQASARLFYIAILFEGMFVGAQRFCAITKIEQANIDSRFLYLLAVDVNFIILPSRRDVSPAGKNPVTTGCATLVRPPSR